MFNKFDYYKRYYEELLVSKVLTLFKIKTDVDNEFLMRHLILDGCCCISEIKNKLYALNGSLGGEPNEYYRPLDYIGANPVLGSYVIRVNDLDKDENKGVMIYLTESSKTSMFSLRGLIESTAELLTDNLISINIGQVNSRSVAFITANSPELRKGAEITLKEIYQGQPYKVLEEDLLSSIKVNPIDVKGVSDSLSQLSELQQFIMANFYKQIGIKANGVMKKERMITDEINEQNVFIAVNYRTMFDSIEKGFDEVNEKYNRDWTIEVPDFLSSDSKDTVVEDSAITTTEETTTEDTTTESQITDESSDKSDLNAENEVKSEPNEEKSFESESLSEDSAIEETTTEESSESETTTEEVTEELTESLEELKNSLEMLEETIEEATLDVGGDEE